MARRVLSNSGRGARDRVCGVGSWGMQGTEKLDRELLDTLGLCGGPGAGGVGASVLGREPPEVVS